MKITSQKLMALCATTVLATPAVADQVIADDLIVQFSACVGNDCVNGESFGFDTLRLKENNLRIHANDTSSSASFPTNDWRIVFNDTSNGGGNFFAIDDVDGGRTPFKIEASAPSNSLYVDNGGRIGAGTSNPVVEMHVVNGDSPTLRLEQDGSSGFTPQTFDIASNEANFFVRDVTNGSQLPFKIKPGADNNALFVAANNHIGINNDNPTEDLHIKSASGQNAEILLEAISPTGGPSSGKWELISRTADGEFAMNDPDNPGAEFIFRSGTSATPGITVAAGTVTATGFIVGGVTLDVPDYVFADDYDLMPLPQVRAFIEENGHLPRVPSAAMVNTSGLNMTDMQLTLLEKVEELTLYTLAQQDTIDALKAELSALK